MKTRAMVASILTVSLAFGVATAAEDVSPSAIEPLYAPADCGAPASQRAPDPRCGDTLDGRSPAGPEAGHGFARGVLAVPRVATEALLWPVVETTDLVEHHHVLDWMQALLTTDDGLVGIRPILNYSTGFLPSVGARLFWRRLPGAHEVALHFETAGSNVMMARLHYRPLAPTGFFFDGMWSRRDDRLFAGIGPNSTSDLTAAGRELARYGSDAFGAEARWVHRLPARLIVTLHGDGQLRNYESTTVRSGPSVSTVFGLPPAQCAALGLTSPCVDPVTMPGFENGMRLLRGGASLRLALREPGREGPGLSVLVDGTYARGVSNDPDQHATLSADGVLAFGGINRTLILRGHAAAVETFNGAPINFEELISPSDQGGMRGFPDGRFRGQSGVIGTAEYRWYISSYLDATLFTDLGTVAGRNFAGIDGSQWFPSYGVGIRSFKTQGAYWNAVPTAGFQVAYSPDYGLRFLLTLAGF